MQRNAIVSSVCAGLVLLGSYLAWGQNVQQVAGLAVTSDFNAWSGGSLVGLPVWVPVLLSLGACVAGFFSERRLLALLAGLSVLLFGGMVAVLVMSSRGHAGVGLWLSLFAPLLLLGAVRWSSSPR